MEPHRLSPGREPQRALKRIERLGWVILAALTLASAGLLPAGQAWGLALGGLLALGNFRCMDLYFARILQKGAARPRWWHHALYGARFIGLLAAVAAAVVWLKASVIGVAAGLSVPLMAISLYGAAAALRRSGKAASAGI